MKARWGFGLVGCSVLLCAAAFSLGQSDEGGMPEAPKPGKYHKYLEPLVGDWNCHVKMWMMPGAPPEESEGTVHRELMMGGLYLKEEYRGEAMGAPFQGLGLMAYDEMRKKYDSIWIDSLGTGIYKQMGTVDASGKTFTLTGENPDPMTGEMNKWTKSVLEIINNDKHVLSMYVKEDGKERKTFEMTVTRK